MFNDLMKYKELMLRFLDDMNTRQEYEEEVGVDTQLADALSDCVDSLLELFAVVHGDRDSLEII